ncbi:class I SAM-dependent DNA methyltransferase [Kamptonema cortianum]|jgi:type I restriction enzyme M protein|nr:class I SAM-dependent DNA methyltransferase [Kamptonema cortianum]
MNNFSEKVNFLWSIAELIRDVVKRGKYQDVILPFTVLRRIDSVLAPTRQQVREVYAGIDERLKNRDALLTKASGFAFYNTSNYDFDSLLGDSRQLARNLRNYINGFSPNMREVLEKFDLYNTIAKLDEAGLLFKVMEQFRKIDLHPDRVSNLEMGYIFEELIRRFNEALNENPGEHFTPREVIQLMVELLLLDEAERLAQPAYVALVYDPCCGTGGMLTVAKDRIMGINSAANVALYGQEVNPETFAVCKSDLYMKSADGRDAENIMFGSTLRRDQHDKRRFDYMIANPPYGKDWKQDEEAVVEEAGKGANGRFPAGTPRISDGQMLFLQHMLTKMRDPEEGGSRVAIVMNGSPLFTGDAGSGESEIRRWILENDWLEALIALPEQLFYNTGISTYIWILSNRKPQHRAGKVQLIDASGFWSPMRKSLGQKRREISPDNIRQIQTLYRQFDGADPAVSKVFATIDFGYRKVTIDRPLKLNFHATPERIERLREQTAFQNLAKSKKRDPEEREAEEAAGRAEQERILSMLADLPGDLFRSRSAFERVLKQAVAKHDLKLSAPMYKAILAALGERDESADICRDKQGRPEADSDLRGYEYIPLPVVEAMQGYTTAYIEDPIAVERVPLRESIYDYFSHEVQPYFAQGEVWINTDIRDDRDGEVGKVGYEINFNRYFYQYQPPRPLTEIEADIKRLERDILDMLREVTE